MNRGTFVAMSEQRSAWFAKMVESGLEHQVFAPTDILAHATPEVLASHLPPELLGKISPPRSRAAMTPSACSETVTPELLATPPATCCGPHRRAAAVRRRSHK
jgi:hypothetical protein